MTNQSDAERLASAKAKRAERARQKGITDVYDRLHKGKLGAHWLWCVIERIGLGHSEAEVMQEYGYYEPDAARNPGAGLRPEPVALAFPHTADFSETTCQHCDSKFYIERESAPPQKAEGVRLVPASNVVDTAPMYRALQFAHTALLPVHSGASIKALSLIDAILNAAPVIQEARGLGDAERCHYCDDTGDVHTPTGEWRGRCNCKAAS